MTNILYLITDLRFGGTEKILFETVTRLDKSVFNPRVYSLKGWGPSCDKLRENNIDVKALDIYGRGLLLAPFMIAWALARLARDMRKFKIDIAHSWLFQANVMGAVSAGIAGVPVVINSVRGMETDFQFFIERLVSGFTRKTLVNSMALKKLAEDRIGLKPERIVVIYNGIDIKNLPRADRNRKAGELGFSASDILVGTAGRLHAEKGMDVLIDAVGILAEKNDNVRCIVAGEGPERKVLENRIRELGLEKKVVLTGFRRDVLEIISILDIFVISSPYEGMPNALLEAMAYGKKIVSTAVGGVNEILRNKSNGVAVQPNDPGELAEGILYLIENPAEAAMMAGNAERDAENFTFEKMMGNLAELYSRELMSVKG